MKSKYIRASIMQNKWPCLILILQALIFSIPASAVTYTDNFSGKANTLDWLPLDDACLTAGDNSGTIKSCATVGTSAPADSDGSGALRLTPAQDNQTGAIISNFTFPTNQGLQVTFTTYSYGGDSGGTAGDGADGISFFLTDGTVASPPTTAGGLGGSLGYSCSNINAKYDGLANAYLGLGIDEYGNFLNSGDNTSTGVLNTNAPGGTSAYGSNSFYASGNNYYQPERIGLRGAGNTNWAALQALNPNYYNDSTPNMSKVTDACSSGQYIQTTYTYNKKGNIKSTTNTPTTIPYNYNAIAGGYAVLPNTQPIADEAAQTRDAGYPITYKLTISPTGLLNFLYSYNNGTFQPVLTNHQITADNGPLPSLFRFGFSSGTGGSDNVHEITCFQASPTQSNSSAGANTIQSGQYKTETQIYLAYFSSDNWFGGLEANALIVSGGTLQASTVATWDASCVLTGGLCPTMGTDSNGNAINTITAEGPSARQILTWNGSIGVPFEWGSLSASEQATLNSTDSNGTNRLAWLRGTRSDEQLQSPPGTLRARTGVLGDIINSSPTFVGTPVTGAYPDTFNDALYSGSSPETPYSSYVSSEATRENVVYVGANDGLLHGFRSGSYNTAGTYDSTTNDGSEVLGFMPGGLLAAGSNIDALTSPTYGHDYFVDTTPGVGDLFYNGAWHTWLVGGLGYGGKEIYALDITNPSNFLESKASSLVMGDWTNAALSHLGNTVGTPVIARLHNGDWAVIFGNGVDSGTSAGVYIGLVNPSTGAVTYQFLDTGVGSASSPNGIAYVSTADLDGDHIADYLYAGDLQGNVWRFDLTSKDPTKWAVSKFGNSTATPLFVATNAGGAVQPITTAISVAAVKTGTVYRVVLYFGTGQEIPMTSTAPNTYASGTQTFYGIWDWDMAAFDALPSTAAPSNQFVDLTGPQSITRNTLLQQVVDTTTAAPSGSTSQVLSYRTVSSTNVICWDGSATCASGNSQFGFYFDFPGTQEQIIYNPVIIGGAVVVNTAIPPTISAAQCVAGQQTGYTMAFSLSSGGGLPTSFFPNENGSVAPTGDGATVAGIQINGVGSLTTVQYGSATYVVSQTVNNTPVVLPINPQTSATPARVSWREIK